MVLQTNSPEEAIKMLIKTRTAIIPLIAAGSFATATVGPAVSQAQDGSDSAPKTGCEVDRENAVIFTENAVVFTAEGDNIDALNSFVAAQNAERLALVDC